MSSVPAFRVQGFKFPKLYVSITNKATYSSVHWNILLAFLPKSFKIQKQNKKHSNLRKYAQCLKSVQRSGFRVTHSQSSKFLLRTRQKSIEHTRTSNRIELEQTAPCPNALRLGSFAGREALTFPLCTTLRDRDAKLRQTRRPKSKNTKNMKYSKYSPWVQLWRKSRKGKVFGGKRETECRRAIEMNPSSSLRWFSVIHGGLQMDLLALHQRSRAID